MEAEEVNMVLNFLQLLVLLVIAYLLWEFIDLGEYGIREYLRNK